MTRDIPRIIAGVLWSGGVVWAVLLGIFAPFAFGLYFICGFAVWFGWLWRSENLRKLGPSVALWMASIAVNGWYLIDNLPLYDFTCWWWMIATIASATALVLEMWIPRQSASRAD